MGIMVISDFVRTLLSRRGITEELAIGEFLEPDYELHTHSPALFQDMEKATARIFQAIERGERIAVYADFDCDGIPGAAILSDFFRKITYANVEVYLPHRDREGYGFHTDAIAALAERGVRLIIIVDVGTTAVDAVRFAAQRGVDVIVSDHHEILGALPDAVAILNPKLGRYPFRDLCGAAVAFKLVQALIAEGKSRGLPDFLAIQDGWEKWLLDMVALATIADMVPLVGENRVLAAWGLRVLRKSRRVGIDALVSKLRLNTSELSEDDIGFSIAPRINAASRMDEPRLALDLLTTQDTLEAERLVAQLEKLNTSRKGVVASIVRQARAHAKSRFTDEDRVVVLGDPEWKPALLGLAANSLMSDRGGVVCLWGRDAAGNLKGSCRSDGEVSLVDLFANAREAFVECGGHAYSGGFSVSHESVHTLHDTLKKATSVSAAPAAPAREPDLHISVSEISHPLFSDIARLAPFGASNPKPLFHIGESIVVEVRRFGKEKNHVELILECAKTGVSCRAFDFFRAPEDFTHTPAQGARARVLGTLERDSYRGGFAVRIVDVLSG